jgi:histidinol-phosphate aminotransferase
MRVGFALGQRPLIDALERVKDSFNSYPLDRLAQLAATAAIEDESWFEDCRRKVIGTRDALSTALGDIGFNVLPSAANFVFARHPGETGAVLQARLRERNIIVRRFDQPRISDFLRITVGTDAQCERLVGALEEIISSHA